MKTGKISFALVDDDKGSIDIIAASLVEAFNKHNIVPSYRKYISASSFLADYEENPIDVLFCDIEMPQMDGIELCKRIPGNKKPTIIFISNREDKVFESLNVHPFGFIRKKNFLNDISEVIENYLTTMQNKNKDSIVLKTLNEKNVVLEIEKIMYIESSNRHQYIHLVDVKEPLVTTASLLSLFDELRDYGFIQSHKAVIVNYIYIYAILTDTIKLKNGEEIFLSRRKAKEVKMKHLELLQETGKILF